MATKTPMTTTLRTLIERMRDAYNRFKSPEMVSRACVIADLDAVLDVELAAALAADQSPEPGEGGGVRAELDPIVVAELKALPVGSIVKPLGQQRRYQKKIHDGKTEWDSSWDIKSDEELADCDAYDLIRRGAEPEPVKAARPHNDDPDFYSMVNQAQHHLKERLRVQDCDADALLEYITQLEASLYAVPVAPEPVKPGELPRRKPECINERCPKCGSTCLSNGKNVWCTFVGGGDEKACDYGIATPVTLAAHLQSRPAEGEKRTTIQEDFQALRDAGGDAWDDIEDPAAFLGRDTPATGPTQAAPTNTYQRTIHGKLIPGSFTALTVDIYDVLRAFNVTDPAIAHATKKLLCAGQRRGDKTRQQDYDEAIESIKRAAIRSQPGGP